ncbi:hypothetical protein VTO42DRAFT_6280 [Malbranchea cinnamomea]
MDEEFADGSDFSARIGSDAEPIKASQHSFLGGKTPNPNRTPTTKVQQPKPQPQPSRTGPSSILVSPRQKGNPVLNHIRLLPWEHADIPADYVLGNTTCALFLSLKYHRLHPEYIYTRIKMIVGKYNLRILLIMVDIPNHEDSLKELSKTSLVNNLTLILCWSAQEAAHYLELFKSSEYAQPTAIKSQQAQSYSESLVEFVTTPRSINKSDAASLISTFGSLQAAVNARPEQISQVPGWGEKKIQQWTHAVMEEFWPPNATKRTLSQLAGEEDSCQKGVKSRDITRGSSNSEAVVEESDEEEVQIQREALQNDHIRRPASQTNEKEKVRPGIMASLAKLREGG